MTIYKIYHIERGILGQFTNADYAITYVLHSNYKFYNIYFGGENVVIMEVK